MARKEVAAAATKRTFSKAALQNSERFRDYKDIVSALLKNDTEYSIQEVESMIKTYMKGEVK